MSSPITLEEIGEKWGRLLSQSFAQIAALEREIAVLRQDNQALSEELRQRSSEAAQEIKNAFDNVGSSNK